MTNPAASDRDTFDDEDTDTAMWRELVNRFVAEGESVADALEKADLALDRPSAAPPHGEVRSRSPSPSRPPDEEPLG